MKTENMTKGINRIIFTVIMILVYAVAIFMIAYLVYNFFSVHFFYLAT